MNASPYTPHSVFCFEDLRKQFPALQRQINGLPVAYLDGPGGTQVPSRVVQALSEYLLRHNANDGWCYPTSLETDEVVHSARRTLAEFLNASPDEIVFGQNMTSLTLHFAQAFGRTLKPGDELVVTELDHHANVDPWKQMARDVGATVRVVRMLPESGRLDWDHLETLLTSKTRLLAIGAASNALGTINDVGRACQSAHAVGALCFVDAVHYAPHQLIDVRAMDCDFLACSAYKFYGPHIGILYGRHDWLSSLPVHKLEPASDSAPKRFETGTQSFEGMSGAAAAVDFIASVGQGTSRRQKLADAFERLHQRSNQLFLELWEGLSQNPLVQLFGPPPGEDRAPTLSFTVKGHTSESVCRMLAESGIFASHGNFYALTVARRMGVEANGMVRIGLACYSTTEEIDRLISVIPRN